MRGEALIHDIARSTSHQIVELFASLLREEEQLEAFAGGLSAGKGGFGDLSTASRPPARTPAAGKQLKRRKHVPTARLLLIAAVVLTLYSLIVVLTAISPYPPLARRRPYRGCLCHAESPANCGPLAPPGGGALRPPAGRGCWKPRPGLFSAGCCRAVANSGRP